MRRMERDETELSLAHARRDPLRIGIRERGSLPVRPPDDDIRCIQRCLVHTLLGRFESR